MPNTNIAQFVKSCAFYVKKFHRRKVILIFARFLLHNGDFNLMLFMKQTVFFAKMAVVALLISPLNLQAQNVTTVRVSYTTPGVDYVVPTLTGTYDVTAELWGGGGGGGGASVGSGGGAAAGGGGGGAYAITNDFTPINNFTIIVGGNGAGGGAGSNGNDGGDTKITYNNDYVIAQGGKGGKGAARGGGLALSTGDGGTKGSVSNSGITVSAGTSNTDGSRGSSGSYMNPDGGAGGQGGSGGAGGAGADFAGGICTGRNGANATNLGAGGGGAAAYCGNTGIGGTGANGKVQLTFSYKSAASPIISQEIPDNLCFENDVVLTIEDYNEMFSYQWYKNKKPIEDATGSTYTVTSPGEYAVELISSITASSFVFDGASSVEIQTNGDGSSVVGTALNIGYAKDRKLSRSIKFVLKYDQSGISDFEQCYVDSTSETVQAVRLTLAELSGNVGISLAKGTGSSFSIDKNNLNYEAANTDINISFTPKEIGVINDTLIIASSAAPAVRIPLSGTGVFTPPTALAATNIKNSGFDANWKTDANAETCLLTVFDNTGTPVNGYDRLDVGNVSSYTVVNLMPETQYSYSIVWVNGSIESEPSNTIEVTTFGGAVITYSQPADFVQEVGTLASKTFRVSGSSLTQNIFLDLQNPYFSLDKTELEPVGGTVRLTFAPTMVGVFEETITLTSDLVDDVQVQIKGTALPAATTLLPATAISQTSFTANWNAEPNAADYLLTVKEGNSIILDNQSTSGLTSYTVNNLTAGKSYIYSVKVVENGLTSTISDEDAVVTHSAPQPTAYPAKTSIRVRWATVPAASGYEVILNSGTPVNLAADVTEHTFTGLSVNTNYTIEVKAVFGAAKYSSGIIFTKTELEFYGAQIANLGFENWEGSGNDREPVAWNSFMSFECSLAIGCTQAKQKKVESNSDIRPSSKGTQSARFWSDNPFGSIVANGNLTTGRIMAGSTNASDAANHNKTLTNNPAFHQRLGDRPDSLTVWVKFVPKNSSHKARITATIHDTYDYKDPNDGNSHAAVRSELNYSSNGNSWQRLSLPFKNYNQSVSPDFVLISFSTSDSPGGGSNGDAVFVDDMLFIYNPSVSIGNPNKAKYIAGEILSIPFTLQGTMSAYNLNAGANEVSLQISDVNGSFGSSPRTLAKQTTDFSGSFDVVLPADLPLSANYKLRVVTTNYPMTSDESTAFELRSKPAVPVALDASELSVASFTANWENVSDATSYLLNVNGTEYPVSASATSYELKNLQPETDYTYKVKALKDDLMSDYSNAVTVTTLGGGVINCTGETVLSTTENEPVTTTQTISGAGLMEEVQITFASNPSGYFSIDTETVATQGGEVMVTYTPEEYGTHTARLHLKSAFADDVYVELTGKNVQGSTPVSVISYSGVTTISTTEHAPETTILTVSGTDLTEHIQVSFANNSHGYFTADLEKIDIEGGELKITYAPEEYGTHTVHLQLRSAFAEDVNVELTGKNEQSTTLVNVTKNVIKLFPNPTADYLNVQEIENGQPYHITDTRGSLVQTGVLTDGKISVHQLVVGLYRLQIGELGVVFIKK